MSTPKTRIFGLFLVAVTVSSFVAPLSVDAATKKLDLYNPKKHYADEKMVITNPASKCATAKQKEKHLTNLDRAMEQGIEFGVTSTTKGELGDAYREYLDGLDIVWDAMNEPYCGFGAFGVTAAYHSYDKSIGHLQDHFLAATKKLGLVAHKTVPKTTASAAKPVAVKETTVNASKTKTTSP